MEQVGSVVHFSIPVRNIQNAMKFYGEMFNWRFKQFTETYWMISGEGMMGALSQEDGMPASGQMPTMYFKVTDVEEAIKRATAFGAKVVVSKTEIGGGHGFYADLRDPDGNLLGVWTKT